MDTKIKKRNESTIFLAILFGILILINVISIKFFSRADLTKDKIFTLSQASTNIVSNLNDRLVVKAYFTKNLPGRYATLERHVQDLLDEYAERSAGQMHVEFIDPTGDEEEEKVAKNLGIQKMPNPDIEKDQATVKEGYRGIAFSYGDSTEVISAVESPIGLEYQVTSLLKKLTGKRQEVGFLVGHGEPEINPPQPQGQQQTFQDPRSRGAYRNIRHNLEIYNYKQIDLKKGEDKVPENLKALVVAGTREPLSDKELYELDQFLLSGGSLAFFVDGVTVDMQQGQFPGMPPQYNTAVNEPKIRNFLEHHGVRIGQNLIMDAQSADFLARCAPIPLPLPRPYPAWPLITSFGEDHPTTFRLGSLTLPYASSVELTQAARDDKNREAREIAFTSGNAWSVDGANAVVDPCSIVASKDLESSIPLAAAVTGNFESYFKNKTLPKQSGDSSGGALNKSFLEASQKPGRLLVVGSSGLPADETIGYLARVDRRQALNNFTFVQNSFDWLTNEDDLIAVRMKTVDDPPLKRTSEGAKVAAKYGNIIGIPLVFILFGLIRWRVRRSKKN